MDIAALLLFALAALCLAHYSHRRRRYNLKPPNQLPSLPRVPIIGHLHLLSDMPHHTFAEMSRRLGPVFYLQLGQVPTVVINSAHVAKLVLKTHDQVFCNRPQLVAAQYLSFGCSDVTFSRYGAYWRQARRICVSELLSPRRVQSFERIRKEEVDRLLGVLKENVGREVDVSKVFFNLANDVLCRVAFGKRFEEEDDEKGGLVEVLKETQELFAGFFLGDFFPDWKWVDWVTGYKRRLTETARKLSLVCNAIIKAHERKKGGQGDQEEDFVDVLLGIKRRGDLEVPITEDNLKALVLDMFVAGTDTTSSTLEWTMTELIRHPEVMKRVQLEVRAAGEVKEGDLGKLRYMKAVVKEAMRLHPAVPLLVPRESMGSCVVGGYEIGEKTRVLINTYAIGRDSRSWEDPLVFDPGRFLGEEEESKDQEFRFLPFGGGRRGCPGYTFGLASIEIALARILYHFDWELPGGVDADGVDLSECFGLASRKKVPLMLVAKLVR